MKINKQTKKWDIFETTAKVILALITLFIAISILLVVASGLPFLGKALHSEETLFSVFLSLYTGSISTILCFLLAIPCAYALTKCTLPFKKTILTIIELPLSLPHLVLGLCLLIVFSSDLGKVLKALGFRVVFDRKGIIIAQMMVNLPKLWLYYRACYPQL